MQIEKQGQIFKFFFADFTRRGLFSQITHP